MKKILCPSMMCADYGNLIKEITDLENAGCDIFHIDIMDGSYVPNFGMGMTDLECIVKYAKIPCDVHLMINNPEKYIKRFAELGVKIIYIHPETTNHPARVLQNIRNLGVESGLVISPHQTAQSSEPLLSLSDNVMVMTVNPGFSGQKYLDFTDKKILNLITYKKEYNFKLFIDGACSPEKIISLSSKGVDGFVLGTSALFKKSLSYMQIIRNLRDNILY